MDCARNGIPILLTLIWLLLAILTIAMPWETLGDGYSGAVPKGPPDGVTYTVDLFKGTTLTIPVANVESSSLIDAFTCHVRMASQTYPLFNSGTCAMFDALRALLLLSMVTGFLYLVLPFALGYSPLTTGLFIATWIGCGAIGWINTFVGSFSKTNWPTMDLDFSGQPQRFVGIQWAVMMLITTCAPILFLAVRAAHGLVMGGYTRMTN